MGYGRVANPDSTLGTDPRTDPRVAAALAPVGLDGRLPLPPVTPDSPLRKRLKYIATAETLIVAGLTYLAQSAPIVENVTTETTTIVGPDGNDITLYISRPGQLSQSSPASGRGPQRSRPPAAARATMPIIVHIHGGGMAFGSATDLGYIRWRENLAATGLVVVGVEFRNSAGKLGPHPFPAGLDDCAAATRWTAAHLDELGGSHIVVSGESGGGNLSLGLTHKAKREGWLEAIAGVYAQCPYISNRYLEQPDDLPSLTENDGYIFNHLELAVNASVYDPDGRHAQDPACWPGTATGVDLTGLPPHVISVNEMDPFRDEGLAYYRGLVRAGVPTIGRVLPGTGHAGEMLCVATMPDLYMATVRDISGFAESMTPCAVG